MSTNVQAEIKGDKLVITIDVSKKAVGEASMSGSGKNKLVASTRGTMQVNGFGVGLNVYCKP